MSSSKTTVSFLTQNRHKFLEAQQALSTFNNVVIEQLDEPKHEDKDDTQADPLVYIAVSAAQAAAKKFNKIVVAEDAGLFFEAYDGFPGMNTKWVMNRIGYDGILRLLDGKNRAAYFRTVLGMADPDGKTEIFEGIVRGRIADKVYGEGIDCMDYDRIFIPDGSDVPFALMMDVKRTMSHRYLAFCKLGEYFTPRLK